MRTLMRHTHNAHNTLIRHTHNGHNTLVRHTHNAHNIYNIQKITRAGENHDEVLVRIGNLGLISKKVLSVQYHEPVVAAGKDRCTGQDSGVGDAGEAREAADSSSSEQSDADVPLPPLFTVYAAGYHHDVWQRFHIAEGRFTTIQPGWERAEIAGSVSRDRRHVIHAWLLFIINLFPTPSSCHRCTGSTAQ